MRRKHEIVEGARLSVWDSPKFIDRFTVVFLDDVSEGMLGNIVVVYLAMNEHPFHPQGFCQHGEMELNMVAYKGRGGVFDKRIKFADLPEDCQKAVLQDIRRE